MGVLGSSPKVVLNLKISPMIKIISTLLAFALLVAFIYVLPAAVITLVRCELSTYFQLINNPAYATMWGSISFVLVLCGSAVYEPSEPNK